MKPSKGHVFSNKMTFFVLLQHSEIKIANSVYVAYSQHVR